MRLRSDGAGFRHHLDPLVLLGHPDHPVAAQNPQVRLPGAVRRESGLQVWLVHRRRVRPPVPAHAAQRDAQQFEPRPVLHDVIR